MKRRQQAKIKITDYIIQEINNGEGEKLFRLKKINKNVFFLYMVLKTCSPNKNSFILYSKSDLIIFFLVYTTLFPLALPPTNSLQYADVEKMGYREENIEIESSICMHLTKIILYQSYSIYKVYMGPNFGSEKLAK